jgi:hypothetical protein
MRLTSLNSLTEHQIGALARALEDGRLSSGLSLPAVSEICGTQYAQSVFEELTLLIQSGFTPKQAAVVVQAAHDGRAAEPDSSKVFSLVLTGPHIDNAETAATEATFDAMVEQFKKRLLIVGFSLHDGAKIFKRLSERMDAEPDLEVTFCFNIKREYGDRSAAEEYVKGFIEEFGRKNWPATSKRKPNLYHFPTSLAIGSTTTSLHAKCYIVDHDMALVTSANISKAAQRRNMEAGVLIRHPLMVDRLYNYFMGAIDKGVLERLVI